MTDQRFQEAVELYGDMVFRLAYSYLKNRADAEDVMQETLLKLYVEPKDFESAEHERRWLLHVAANECKKLLRSPWRRRTAPCLYYYEGYSVKETGELLGAKASTVQTWLMRARGQLKTKLKEAEA